ncbi:MAG: SUMF1/EgtB/PvdO family nonheme iron enzyme, partial [Pseudomonadota bacterium]
ISYAQAEYSRQSGEAIDDDSGAEPGVRPSSDLANDLADLRGDLQSVEDETEQLGRKIEAETVATSERADQLGRQVQDAGSHAGIARNELEQAAPKPGRLERINRVLRRLPDRIEKTGKAMEVVIDVAEPFADQWFNQLPTDIFNLVVKHIRLVSKNIEKAGQRLKKGFGSSKPSNGRPPLTIFREIDEPWCPEMVMLPAGTFLMGSPEGEAGRYDDEGPQREVTIGRPFALGRYPVTFDEYDHFCAETRCDKPDDRGWGRGRRPVINVSHSDAEAYCAWLSELTGSGYQLPSEAMWEYACRAWTTTADAFGNGLTREQANFRNLRQETSDVGAYPANAWLLHDMHGNVWEWCQDWYHENYEGAPNDGSAWLDPPGTHRLVRGGSWNDPARDVRSAYRNAYGPGNRVGVLGFRCAGVQEQS